MTNPDEIGSGSQDHLTPETIGPEYIFPQDRPGTIISDKYERAGGMQLRDYMAAQALPGIQAQGTSITNAAMNAAMNAATVAYAIASPFGWMDSGLANDLGQSRIHPTKR